MEEQADIDGTESKTLLTDPPAVTLSSERSHDDDLAASKLPTRRELPLILYKKYWLLPHHAANIMTLQESFKARHGDTILATNPKCGTTWLKALAFAISTRSRYSLVVDHHPLLTRHPHELVPFIEIPLASNKDLITTTSMDDDTLASPTRLLATHMPFSLLPESIVADDDHGCRIVYLCREPKDAFVAGWHFANRMRLGSGGATIDLDTAFNLFCEGFWPMGPFWDHCLEYWKESIARPDRVLFLKYGEMMLEPVKHVGKLATFLGDPFTDEEESNGVPEEVVRLCSFETLSGVQEASNGAEGFVDGQLVIEKSAFFRKGKVGDWANYMSEQMGRKLDMVVEEKLKGSGLEF